MRCPSDAEYGMFFAHGIRDQQRAEAIAEHLAFCMDCQRRMETIPSPPHRGFGRPLPPALYLDDRMKMEDQLRFIQGQVNKGRKTGLVIKVGGDWMAQDLVYTMCAILIARVVYKAPNPTTIQKCGMLLTDTDAPTPDLEKDFALLLEAPTFRNLEDWTNLGNSKQVRILIGSVAAWARRGYKPDILMEPAGQTAEEYFSPYFADLRQAVESDTPLIKAGVLLSANSCDIPQAWFGSEPAPSPFVQLEGDDSFLPFYSTPGTWLADEFIRRQPTELVKRLKDDLSKQELPQTIRERLQFRHTLQ